MADSVDHLSLADYIKKKNITRGGKIRAGKSGPASGARGRKGPRVSAGGRGARGGRGRSTTTIRGRQQGQGRGRVNVGRGGSAGRGRRGQARNNRGGIQRRRTNFRNSIAQTQNLIIEPLVRSPNQRGRFGRFQSQRGSNIKTRFPTGGMRAFPNTRTRGRRPRGGVSASLTRGVLNQGPGVQSLVRKRVNKAKRVLARRGAGAIMGRIGVSPFGLVTIRRTDARRQREIIQQKINRARTVRNGGGGLRSDLVDMDDLNSPGSSSFFAPTTQPRLNVRNSRSRSRGRQRQQQHPLNRNDTWTGAARIVQNTNTNVVKSTLNPEIQRKIMLLQQQGRVNRGEDRDGSGLEMASSGFTKGHVATSSLSLSERFRMFQN